jgi:hypothetical protein
MLWGKKPDPVPTILTEETCNACGERTRRLFEVGDNVYELGKACTKCSSSTLVTAIYGEYPLERR